MRHFMKAMMTISIVLLFARCAPATVYDFTAPSAMSPLDHAFAYKWGISFKLKPGEVITSAVLTFKNIYNWQKNEPGNILYVDLLDKASAGLSTFVDNSASGDYFANQGTSIGTWTDTKGGAPRDYNLSFSLSKAAIDTLTRYMADGMFGIGCDPDCHYYDSGITFRITTGCAPVPEPGSFFLMGIGLFAPFAVKMRTIFKK